MLLGSAFASGQEAMQFYVAFGVYGLLGCGVTFVLFTYIAYSLLQAGRTHKLISSEAVFKFYCGPYLGAFFTWYALLFIASIYFIMLVGAGATLHQAYGLPEILGRSVMGVLAVATILLGLTRIVDVLGFVGPLLIAITVAIAVWTLMVNATDLASNIDMIPAMNILKSTSNWFASSIIYVGFSLMGLASFLPAVGTTLPSKRDTVFASILGPLLFMGAMLLVSIALMSKISDLQGVQMPVMHLAIFAKAELGIVFAVVIFLGIYTTASPLLWAVCAKFSSEKKLQFKAIAILLTLLGVVGGGILPFDRLVNLIYPTVGYAGAIFVLFVVAKDLRRIVGHSRVTRSE